MKEKFKSQKLLNLLKDKEREIFLGLNSIIYAIITMRALSKYADLIIADKPTSMYLIYL